MQFPGIFSWNNRRFIQFGVLIFCLLSGTTFWILQIIKTGVREDVSLNLQTIQNSTHEAIHYWRDLTTETVIGIANRSIIRQHIDTLIKSGPAASALRKNAGLAALRKELQPFLDQHQYNDFYVVARNQINYGSLHDHTLGRNNLLRTRDSQSLLQGFAGETVFSKPVISDIPPEDKVEVMQDNRYAMFVITPVTNRRNNVIALLMFRIPLREQFKKILNVGRFGKTGESYIINDQGMLLSPSRFEIPLMQAGLIKPDSSSNFQLVLREPGGDITRGYRPAADHARQPLTHIVNSILQNKVHFDLEPALDYRGVKVVNIGVWDDHEGLGFITQIDYLEAFNVYRTVRNALFMVTGIAALLLASLIVSLINSRQSALRLVHKRTIQLKRQNQSLEAEIEERKQIEQALKNNRTRTDAILQSAFDAIIAADPHGYIELVNPAAVEMFGFQEHELLGQNVNILMPENVASKHDFLIRQHQTGKVSNIVGRRREMVASRKDGGTFPIELAVEETIIDGKRYFISTINDISERKAMMERVSASERNYKAIINNLNDTFYRTDTAGKIIMTSPSAEQLLGYRLEELIGFNVNDLYVDPRGQEKFLLKLREHNGSVSDYEVQLQRKDSIVIWVSTNAHFYTDDYGNPAGVEGTTRDITARKLAEEEIRESRQRLAFHMQQTPLGVIEWDIDFKIVEWNPAAEKIFGYSRNEAIGRHAAEVIIPDELKPSVDDMWYALLGKRGGQHSTNQNINKQGELIWCEWYNTPLVDENWNVIGVASMVMDVTARKKAEEILARDHEQLQALVEARTDELNIARIEAERANEAKSEFLANMSHELRTPIHTILSFAEMGMKKADRLTREKLALYFTNIYQGGERQLHLLNDLLDLSKLEDQGTAYEFAGHDIRQIIEEQIAQHELLLHKKQLRIEIEPAPLDTCLSLDRVRIEQVVRNLLSNAIKFSAEAKTIRIKLGLGEIRRQADSAPALMVTVSDEGVGVPVEELQSIFDKFVQSSKTRTGAGGTGLGLAICQEIIKAHGGEIWAENNKQGGASFSFTLPILRAGRTAAEPKSKTN